MDPSLGAKQQTSKLDWKHPTSPVKKKFMSQLSVGRDILTLFEICVDQPLSIIRKGMWRWTVYIALKYFMMSCSWRLSKFQGQPSKDMLSIPLKYSSGYTVWFEHPPYNPDLGPSHFHLFEPFRYALRSRFFVSDLSLRRQCICDLPTGWKYFFS
jgi:hypothetical protein